MKIKIKKIKFKNIFSYGNKIQEFEPDGICFITGLNTNTERRNFTGKSNLLKIIQFALYGQVQGLTKKRIINWKNRKNTETFIYIEKNNVKYCIHRGIKPDIFEIFKNGEKDPIPSTNKNDLQRMLDDDILEMDYDTFMNIYYADGNNNVSILSMGKPQKRKFLETIFNLSYYSRIKDNATIKLRSINEKINLLNTTNIQLRSRIDDIKTQKENYLSSISQHDVDLEEYKEREKANKLIGSKLLEVEKNLINTEKEKIELEKSIVKEKEILFKIQQKLRYILKFDVDVEFIDVESVKKQLEDVDRKIAQVDSQIKPIDREIAKINLDDLNNKKVDVLSKITEQKTLLNQEKIKLVGVENNINEKSEETNCPFCYQKVDHKLIETRLLSKKTLSQHVIADIEKKIESFTEQLNEIQSVIDNTNNLKDSLKILLKKSVELDSEKIKVEDDLKRSIENNDLKYKKEKYRKARKKLNDKHFHITENIKSVLSEIESEESSIEGLKFLIKDLESKIKEFEIFKAKCDIAKKEKNELKNLI